MAPGAALLALPSWRWGSFDDVTDASSYDLDDDEVAHLVTSGRDTVTTEQNEAITEAPEGPA